MLGVASTQLSNMFIGPAHLAAFGVLTSVPIFTAGGIAGQVKQAEARREQALFNYQRVILIALREVEDALVALQKAREQLNAVNRRVTASRTYLEMAQMRYEEGYISFIEVLDAQRTLFEADTTQADVQGRVFNSLVNLYKALGGGWVVEAEDMALGEVRRIPATESVSGPAGTRTTPRRPDSHPGLTSNLVQHSHSSLPESPNNENRNRHYRAASADKISSSIWRGNEGATGTGKTRNCPLIQARRRKDHGEYWQAC